VSLRVDWALAIPRFLDHADLIRAHEHNRYVTIPGLAAGLYIGGGGNLFLGWAVTAWASGALTKVCPSCSGRAHVVFAGGSPLSGAGVWRGWCPCCGMVSKAERVTDLVLHPEIRGHWGKLGYQPVIQRGDPWVFDFRDGAIHTGLQRETLFHLVAGWREFMAENYPDCLTDDGTPEGAL